MSAASNATDPLSRLVYEAVRNAIADENRQLTRRLLDTAQTAEYLGVSEDTIRRLHADGRLKKVKIAGVKLMFDVKDLDRAIEDNK